MPRAAFHVGHLSPAYISEETLRILERTRKRRHKILYRYSYYHKETIDFLNQHIASDSRVLWVGLDVRERSRGLKCREVLAWELDTSEPLPKINQPIDYVVLPYTLQFLYDIQSFLHDLQPALSPSTRLVFIQYNFLWAPLIKLVQWMGLKSPMPDLNWLNFEDIKSFLLVTGYQDITSGHRCLMPFYIPILTYCVNRYISPLPFINSAGQKSYIIARPLMRPPEEKLSSVSIVVPARNEAGNVASLLNRVPVLGKSTEVIFVEGHSKDNTWDIIQQEIRQHPRKEALRLKAFQQTGIGKADAVRLGFSKATGDILMILDADLTVQPEDLTNFYEALTAGHAEFLNGSRLIYQMDAHAMQLLNLFFNKVFANLISWLIGQRIKDSLCGTKALYRVDYERIRHQFAQLSRMDPFGDFELLLGSSKLCLKISDIMVRYKSRTYGSTNIQRFWHGWQLLRLCIASWGEMK